MLFVQDPSIVRDMYGSKNALIDKTGKFEAVFKNLFGNSFVFSKGDNIWKEKRRASSHAFYKDRLVHMIEALKEKVFEQQNEWLSEITQNSDKDGSVTIDLGHEVLKIFQRALAHIIFGDEELNSEEIEITHRTKDGGGFEQRTVQFSDAIEEIFQQTIITVGPRIANPLWNSLYALTGKSYAFSEM